MSVQRGRQESTWKIQLLAQRDGLPRCKSEMERLNSLAEDTINKNQLLFGINQGGIYDDIRIEHAKQISELDLDGYAVGGLAVGETHEEMYRILESVVPYLTFRISLLI